MRIEEQVLLAPFSTFHVGGKATYFVRVKSVPELLEALRWAKKHKIRFFILGGGSNILIGDNGFDGLVIKIELLGTSFTDRGEWIEAAVASGESWDAFVAQGVSRGLYGIENLSGIPGTVGGTPVQNVAAYGAEVAGTILFVDAIDTHTLQNIRLNNEKCFFSYRNSFFKTLEGSHVVITQVIFRLEKKAPLRLTYREVGDFFKTRNVVEPTLSEVRRAILEIRSKKFPDLSVMGTAGSFFKNPSLSHKDLAQLLVTFPSLPYFPLEKGGGKIALGWLLEELGWKGAREERAGVFERHALVLVNFGGASAADINGLAHRITVDVAQKTGIAIEPEIISVS